MKARKIMSGIKTVPLKNIQLQKKIRDLETVIESSYDGLSITDKDGIVLHLNHSYQQITGLKSEEVVGNNMENLIQQGYYDQSVTRLVIQKKARVTINQNIRGRQFLVTGNPIFNDQGDLYQVVTNLRDISELTKLQDQLLKSQEQALRYQTELSYLRSVQMEADGIIFRSPAMEQAVALAKKVAGVDSTVLISGESGTGKELIAKLIHRADKGTARPFIKINCAALPEPLLESELFGYEKGSFTGANNKGKPGLFELAHNGTLFLDEIGDMPLALQVKILRVLQEKEMMRVGGLKPITVHVRIIAATNRDLEKMVDNGTFREDLYYRLMVVPIYLPPLRERKEDIPILIHHFMDKYNKKFNYNKQLSNQVVEWLIDYPWRGNVRELENLIERMIVTTNDQELTTEHLPEGLRKKILLPTGGKMREAVKQLEANLLGEAYKRHLSWNKVAEKLGIDPATAYRKAKKYGLLKR